jgi:hypothetical protein
VQMIKVMRDPTTTELLQSWFKTLYTLENWNFLQEYFNGKVVTPKIVKEMYDEYINVTSPSQVNVNHERRREWEKTIQAENRDVLVDVIGRSIFDILQLSASDTFRGFKNSDQGHVVNLKKPVYHGKCMDVKKIANCIKKDQDQDLAIVALLELSNQANAPSQWSDALSELFHTDSPELFKKVVRLTMVHFFDETVTEEHKNTLEHLEEPCMTYMIRSANNKASTTCLHSNQLVGTDVDFTFCSCLGWMSKGNIQKAYELVIPKVPTDRRSQAIDYLTNPKVYGVRGNQREASFQDEELLVINSNFDAEYKEESSSKKGKSPKDKSPTLKRWFSFVPNDILYDKNK